MSDRHYGVKVCDHCNTPFHATGPRHRWCTPACGVAWAKAHAPVGWKQVPRTCVTCGGQYLPGAWTQTHCSTHCKWISSHHAGRAKARVCEVCGGAFATVRERSTCWTCRPAPRQAWDRSPRVCGWCHAEYTPGRTNQAFCGESCRRKAGKRR